MALYIDKAGLAPSLRSHNWPTFARGYNGPAYAQSGYDLKIAAAYNSYAKGELSTRVGPSLLRKGSKGEAVADLQRSLTALGYPLAKDDDFGPATAQAVKRFQADHALAADGIAGPKTLAALQTALASHGRAWDLWSKLTGWLARLFGRG
jgi:murein L,D-transpeptidase YcbB/YkuD